MERYLPTGNEQISIPRLNEVTAAIEDITFLYMACRGLLDLRGGKAQPLMQPFVEADGTPLPLQDLCWRREAYWVPAFTAAAGPFGVEAWCWPRWANGARLEAAGHQPGCLPS